MKTRTLFKDKRQILVNEGSQKEKDLLKEGWKPEKQAEPKPEAKANKNEKDEPETGQEPEQPKENEQGKQGKKLQKVAE